MSSSTEVVAVKDGTQQRPVPTAWRPVFREIVDAFVARDYGLTGSVPGVEPVSTDKASQIREYVDGYGATLAGLSDETWESSVCIWYGTHWDALIDLWTEEEGRSDLVLHAKVSESGSGFSFSVYMVYVP